MQKILGITLGLSLLLQSSVAYAATTEADLKLQLGAIIEYLERLQPVSNEPLTAEELRTVINDSAAWTVSSQEANGHFGYEYLPFEDEYLNDDGMVRQAGTLFMLSEVYKHQTEKDSAIAETIEQAIAYFESISQDGKENGISFRCIKNNESSTRCDLGSSALALIGIISYVTAEPEKAEMYQLLMDDYLSYIKVAKFPGAGFSSRFVKRSGLGDKESSFYNGEAMLALVRYYQYQEDEELKTMLEDLFVYLSSKEEFESPLYLWIMAALKDMQKLWPDQLYVDYATEFTNQRITSSYFSRGKTTNYCAPLEGLVSAYSVLDGSAEADYLTRLRTEIDFWLRKSLRLQLLETQPYRLVATDDTFALVKMSNPDIAHGGFLTSDSVLTQRIDFTQHCASAYLQTLVDIEGEEL